MTTKTRAMTKNEWKKMSGVQNKMFIQHDVKHD